MSFAPPMALGFTTQWQRSLAGSDQGLWLLWPEHIGGKLHLQRSSDGTTFDDLGVTVQTRAAPALALDAENRRLALIWAERSGAERVTIGLVDIDNPDPAVPVRTSLDPPPQALRVSAAFVGGHGGRRVLIASERDVPGPGGLQVEGRTASCERTDAEGLFRFRR